MAGFTSFDQIIGALSAGRTFKSCYSKNFNPTAAAVANEWHTLFRGAGNPPADAIFNTGSNAVFNPLKDSTANAGCLLHGGNVQPTYNKFLLNGSCISAAATVVPCMVALIDVLGWIRVTPATNTAAQNVTNTLAQSDTWTVVALTDLCTWSSSANIPSNLLTGTMIKFTTSTTLPSPLVVGTPYYFIKVSDTTFKIASSYANAIANSWLDITDTGTGVHTCTWLLPRYTNGAGVNCIFFANNATPLGAGVPNLYLPSYTNAEQTAARATPTVYPIGKTGSTSSHICYTGATGVGKFNYNVPFQAGDSGIASIEQFRNDATYTSGEYSIALIKEIGRFPLSVLGLGTERNFMTEMPSMPRIYDGAALYFLVGSGVATPANSAFNGHLDFVWN